MCGYGESRCVDSEGASVAMAMKGRRHQILVVFARVARAGARVQLSSGLHPDLTRISGFTQESIVL